MEPSAPEARIGGIASILAGVLTLVGFVMVVIPFAAAPPEALDLAGFEARVAFAGSLSPSLRTLFLAGTVLNSLLVPVLSAVFVLVLFGILQTTRQRYGVLATGLAILAVPLLVLARVTGFLLVWAGERYAAANAALQASIVETYATAETVSIVADAGFRLFLGAAMFGFYYATEGVLPRWVRILGVVLGAAGIVGSYAPLFPLAILADVLFVAWLLAAGAIVYRKGRRVA